eukprot:gene15326-18728_t
MLLDKAGRIKPCGGAIPPRLMRDFDIPAYLLCAHANAARMIAPSGKAVDMPIEGGYVGMVNRDTFDEFLRERAAQSGAERRKGEFERLEHQADGPSLIHYVNGEGQAQQVTARYVIGADG